MELESQSLEWQAMQIKGLMMKPICLAILFAFMALRPAQAAPCGPQYSQPCTETDTAATQVEKRQGKWGSNDSEWTTSFRHCSAEKQFSVNGDTTFGENQEVLVREWGVRWLRLSEQNFRVDKWSLCRVRPPRGKAAS